METLRRATAQDLPAIAGNDQDEYARRLHYDRPYEASLEAFRWARASTVELLERLTPDDWRREGTHSEIGPFGVETWLEIYGQHAHRHARQNVEARRIAARD